MLVMHQVSAWHVNIVTHLQPLPGPANPKPPICPSFVPRVRVGSLSKQVRAHGPSLPAGLKSTPMLAVKSPSGCEGLMNWAFAVPGTHSLTRANADISPA